MNLSRVKTGPLRRVLMWLLCLGGFVGGSAGAQTNLNDVPADLVVPGLEAGAPAAGRRVRATTAGWEGTEVQHALYLPVDWQAGGRLPVIVEYAGNGGYANKLGDTSDGSVGGCMLGYGLSAGRGFIWITLPFVATGPGRKWNAEKWWGDVGETKRYCIATVRDVCRRYGGDPERVVLAGFSRGAIGCNFLGLHDDRIADVWLGFIAYSHYDGVRQWTYAGSDRAAARERLARLKGRAT
ncbi:MAG: hypothetical protein NTV51_12665, partial [Verrucomicrobia bacterium]|nr:hypothetical protein [Verrucomicrobiota bacterium]